MRQFRWMVSLSLMAALTACTGGEKREEAGPYGPGSGGDTSSGIDTGSDIDAGSGIDTGSGEASGAVVGRPLLPIPGAADGSGVRAGSGWSDMPFAANEAATPQHPFLAPNPWSNIHNDGAMTDAYAIAGPRGVAAQIRSGGLRGLCGSIAFRSDGLLVTVCIELAAVRLHLVDPVSFTLLASRSLPPRSGGVNFGDFGGGGYFYLDAQDRAVVPTSQRQIEVVEAKRDASGWHWESVATRNPELASSDRIVSALPDAAGNLWFVSSDGVTGYFEAPFTEGSLRVLSLGEPIANSFAVDQDGAVYLATTTATYRLIASAAGPVVVWQTPYANSGLLKPGQVSAGTGTTPTLFADEMLTITDNADPMQVVVMRRSTGEKVCEVPVFEAGASATENSLIAAGRSVFVENNFGYTGPTLTGPGPSSRGGFARVDLLADGSGCQKVWERAELTAPSVVAKASRATGLLYTYTRPRRDVTGHDWAFAALSLATGDPVWEIRSGSGAFLNNNYAGLALGPDGAAYLGTLGGFVRLTDGR